MRQGGGTLFTKGRQNTLVGEFHELADVIPYILQGLTVTSFKFHLLVPQALSIVRPPSYGMNY